MMACRVATWIMLSLVAVSPGVGTFEEELWTKLAMVIRQTANVGECERTSYSSFAMLVVCLLLGK